MAYVYWVRLPEHVDMFSQGYIGVTTKKAGGKERFREHVLESRRYEYARYRFGRAIRKYGDMNLIVTDVVIGSDEYCYDLEFKLRPHNNIGWNMAAGGQRPMRNPDSYGDEWRSKLRYRNLGKVHNQDTKEKLSEISLYNHSRPEYRKRLIEISNGKKTSKQPKERFWRWSVLSGQDSVESIIRAKEIHDLYWSSDQITSGDIVLALNLQANNAKVHVTKLTRYFRSGWVPHNDPLWLEDFKEV